MYKGLTLLRATVAVLLTGAALIVVVLPPGLYWLGLSNIEGRPERPMSVPDLAGDTAVLQRDFRIQGPIVIDELNPWSAVLDAVVVSRGARPRQVAAFIAQKYDAAHLKDRRMLWWHLSALSLTVWITRHWTREEIITAAAALDRRHPNPFLTRTYEYSCDLSLLECDHRLQHCPHWALGRHAEPRPTDVVGNPGQTAAM